MNCDHIVPAVRMDTTCISIQLTMHESYMRKVPTGLGFILAISLWTCTVEATKLPEMGSEIQVII